MIWQSLLVPKLASQPWKEPQSALQIEPAIQGYWNGLRVDSGFGHPLGPRPFIRHFVFEQDRSMLGCSLFDRGNKGT